MAKATAEYCEVRPNILWGVSKRRRNGGGRARGAERGKLSIGYKKYYDSLCRKL